MIHARQDYNERIFDAAGKIPEDMPVFLLLASDVLAPTLVDDWADRAEHFGAQPAMVDAARRHATAIRKWQREHGRKVPDMPESKATQ